MDHEGFTESERLQIEQIRELDLEELQIEEVDDDFNPDEDDVDVVTNEEDEEYNNSVILIASGAGASGPLGGFTFNTMLASMHTYLGEVDDTRGRMAFLDGGAVFTLPMFYLEGVVLFPEATLPLRVIQPRFKAAVERALRQTEAPFTIGVVRVHRNPGDPRIHYATTGTTAEIRQFRQLFDGQFNVVARGQQRFHLRRRWIDVEGAPCAEVQIVQEDTPLRTPKDAFGQLASVANFRKYIFPSTVPSGPSPIKYLDNEDTENSSDYMSASSSGSDPLDLYMKPCLSANDFPTKYEPVDASSSSDEELFHGRRRKLQRSHVSSRASTSCYNQEKMGCESVSSPERRSSDDEIPNWGCSSSTTNFSRGAMSFWPHWVYQMYDSYALARRAADLWGKVIGNPRLDDYIKKPDLLSFHIASKLPVSESTRQELLDIDGVSYRLQKEIELLKCFNLVRCKNCLTLIAKRSDMVVMSSDGPLNAYVNPHGYVHEVITVYSASGLALIGSPVKEHSWFPGYAWTITNCAVCESNMGWLFTATKKNLLPSSFWGIRSSQVADETSNVERERRSA